MQFFSYYFLFFDSVIPVTVTVVGAYAQAVIETLGAGPDITSAGTYPGFLNHDPSPTDNKYKARKY